MIIFFNVFRTILIVMIHYKNKLYLASCVHVFKVKHPFRVPFALLVPQSGTYITSGMNSYCCYSVLKSSYRKFTSGNLEVIWGNYLHPYGPK